MDQWPSEGGECRYLNACFTLTISPVQRYKDRYAFICSCETTHIHSYKGKEYVLMCKYMYMCIGLSMCDIFVSCMIAIMHFQFIYKNVYAYIYV